MYRTTVSPSRWPWGTCNSRSTTIARAAFIARIPRLGKPHTQRLVRIHVQQQQQQETREKPKKNSLGLIKKPQEHGHLTDVPLTSPARLASDILIGMNVILFVLQLLFPETVSGGGIKVNALIDQGEYYRLLTAAFLHGSPSHLLLNMLSLHSLGSICEWTCGKERFLIIYLLSAIMGNVASYYGTPDGASLGASGAIFGLAGALIVYFARNKVIFRDKEVPKGLVMRLVATVGCNFLIGSVLPVHIDEYGHLGGLVTGMIVCGLLGPAYELCRLKDTPGIWLVDNPPVPAGIFLDQTPHLVYYDGE